MSEATALEALQALHRDLVAVCDHRFESLQALEQQLDAHAAAFKELLNKPPRRTESRNAVTSGKIKVGDDEYSVNKEFQEIALQLADELDLDEVISAKVLLESQDDQSALGRSLLECGLIRFHQQRKYLLDCIRLCVQLAADDDLPDGLQDGFGIFVSQHIYGEGVPGEPAPSRDKKIISRCMGAMRDIKMWLQKLSDRLTTAAVVSQANTTSAPEVQEMVEFSRVSLVQQHELLAVILCSAVEKRMADVQDFEEFLTLLKRLDRYDHLLVHLFPLLGAYINMFGSTEGIGDLTVARRLNSVICKQADDDTWLLTYFHAAARAWWIIEYSGWYLDDVVPDSAIQGVDLDEEDKERTKHFTEALKDGAFDFILSVAADIKTPDWQDPARSGIRQWLQRKSPSLSADTVQFSDFFQNVLMLQLEVFVEGFISNLPDVLRKLRVEEDEQRQLSQAHEQDLDLERFLLIIAYAYEGRPDAAEAFWSDPDSNLAGFMHWASRRASTPLVSAFCEMLQSIAENDDCATSAHEFLQDDSQHSSGKMRKTLSLTWSQIFRELLFFSGKIRERPTPAQSHLYRGGKPTSEQAETEPESAMMLECYLRLITKLSSRSEVARQFLLKHSDFNLVELLYQLASSSIPARLRACAFHAAKSLITRKSQEEGSIMWTMLDGYMTGQYYVSQNQPRQPMIESHQNPAAFMERLAEEIAVGFEEPNAFIELLISLVSPVEDASNLNDALPFPETLGSNFRLPGIDPYVDYVLGKVFGSRSKELQDVHQLRILRLTCLEFVLLCLETFNENLIIIANESNIAVDSVISTTDLATYVKLHPFARVMEWMFNDRVMSALFSTIHQDGAEVGSATPNSPLILGILRGVEVFTKVLELQSTYLDLVRPLIKLQSPRRKEPVANAVYASFEDGIMSHLDLIVDLGRYCGMGHPALTLACLKLLEKISASSKIISAWNPGPGKQSHRNKAIVALEADGEAETIAGSFVADLTIPLDLGREAESPTYMIKIYILDFLYACLQATPNQPTIAHLLLGFRCGLNALSIEPDGDFDSRTSLFHNMLRVLLETPFGDDDLGMRQWLVALKYKIVRVLQILWSSPLSSPIVLDELRENDFLFHLLLREVSIGPNLPWDGQDTSGPEFLISEGSTTFLFFLSLRAMTFEYMSIELCSVSQKRLPNLKRRIFDALNGQLKGDDNESIPIPTVFDLFDFLGPEAQWDIEPPTFNYYRDLDLRTCLDEDEDSVATYDIDKVREILLLKRNEGRSSGQVISKEDAEAIDKEETLLLQYLAFSNRQRHMNSYRLKVLKSWTNLLLVMFESNEFQGSARVSFLLQALQAALPSLESYGSDSPDEALELAKLAKMLLFKMDFSLTASDESSHTVGNLISDKLFQVFQICLQAIGKWAGNSELRSIYYAICYRYLTGIVDKGSGFLPGRQKTIKSVQLYGERLLNVISDDAYGSDPQCQTAALIVLGAFVNLGRAEEDPYVVNTLNKLNVIGVLVDSLKSVLQEWLEIVQTNNLDHQLYWDAKLSLLLQLCQTRDGAKYVLHANLFRSLEVSGLFSADPELEIDPTNTVALEKHYTILVRVARIIGAAILSRGSHNVVQGRRFLTDHRMLVMHVLKRSAGIGAGHMSRTLEDRVEELADAFMVLITATDFLEFEEQQAPVEKPRTPLLFH